MELVQTVTIFALFSERTENTSLEEVSFMSSINTSSMESALPVSGENMKKKLEKEE